MHHCYYSIMSTTTSTLPCSVTSGFAYNAFDKLQGVKSYADWKVSTHTMLLSLRQWGMIDLRTQLSDTVTDQAFHCYFAESLPPSLDSFIASHDDMPFDIDLPCERFTGHEMRQKSRATKLGKIDGSSSSDGNVALFGLKSAERKKKSRNGISRMSRVTAMGRRATYYPTKKHEKPKDEKSTTQGEASTSKTDKADATSTEKPPSGVLYPAIFHASVPPDGGLTDSFYVNSGASNHLVPSKADLCDYREFERPLEIAAADSQDLRIRQRIPTSSCAS